MVAVCVNPLKEGVENSSVFSAAHRKQRCLSCFSPAFLLKLGVETFYESSGEMSIPGAQTKGECTLGSPTKGDLVSLEVR